jgi:hypothetical protein
MEDDDIKLREGAGCENHKYKARGVANSSVYREVLYRCEECLWNKRTFKHRNMTMPETVEYWPSRVQLYDNEQEPNDWKEITIKDVKDNGLWTSQ